MIDTSKLVAYLRRFECRDRDGNYWSPQEIIEAADRLEQLDAKIHQWKLATQLTGTHRTCECAACEELRTSIAGCECSP